MARSYTSTPTSIWAPGSRFRELTSEQQGIYHMLSSQPNITAAGTLPLTLKRWGAMSAGNTTHALRATLATLEAAGWIVVDDDTEELLVRPFVRQDKGYANPKRRPVILDAAHEVVSERIRQVLAAEFASLGLPADGLGGGPPAGPRPSDSQSDRRFRAPMAAPEADTGHTDYTDTECETHESQYAQVNRLSDSQSDGISPSERIVVTTTATTGINLNPQSSILNPSLAHLVAAATGADDDETKILIDEVRRKHNPKNLNGYIRTMAASGDLAAVLADHRAARDRATERAAAADQRRARLEAIAADTGGEDPPMPAADARAQIRAINTAARARRGRSQRPTALGRRRSA